MPEFAEVELARRLWEAGLSMRITSVEAHPGTRIFRDGSARAIASALTGAELLASRAHGKRLLFTFSPPGAPGSSRAATHLEVHLGMAGRLFPAPAGYQAGRHDHLLLRGRSLALVFSDYRQFGRLVLHRDPDPWAALPPQPLDPGFNLPHLARLTSRQPRRALKALLLDQTAFPGIGNWMADEICWRLPCHPATPAGRVDPALLRRIARRVCRGAIRHVADRNAIRHGINGFSPGRYVEHVPPPAWLFRHRWKPGGRCPRCGSTLARSTIASRSTAWCPFCQPPQPPQA